MVQLRIASLILLIFAFGWALVLLRRQRDWRLIFIGITVGFIALRELGEVMEISGFGSLDGQWHWMRDMPVGVLALVAVGFLGLSLAEQRKVEEKLRRGDLTYKGVFEAASDAILVVDRESKLIVDVNRAACEKYCYAREGLVGKPITGISAEPEKTAAAIASGENHVALRYHLKKDGHTFPVEITSSLFSQNEEAFYVSLVRDISERLQAEKLMQEHQSQLARQNLALGELSRSNVWEQQGLNAAFRQITEVTSRALEVDRVSIWLCDSGHTKIICQDLYERRVNQHFEGAELRANDFPAYFAALAEDRAIAAHNAHTDSRTKEFATDYLMPLGIASMLDASIRMLGNQIGVVCLEQVGDSRFWTPEEEAFAGSVADFVTIAIEAEERQQAQRQLEESHEQLRQLAAHLQKIREEERKRISREVHDELGQVLTGFKFELKLLDRKLREEKSELAERTGTVLGMMDEAMRTVRRIATDLRPGILDELGLIAAIEWQTREFQARTQIQCELIKNVDELRIGGDPATAIFRIFQETLTNVARHSGASKVCIGLGTEDGFLFLRVRDNGCGFSEKDLRHSRSLGMLGMRERAQIFGGQLTITSEPQNGAEVILRMPQT